MINRILQFFGVKKKITFPISMNEEAIDMILSNKEMLVWKLPPPMHIYQAARERFGPTVDWDNGTIFTWGYNVFARRDLTPDLWIHEETHVRQQTTRGISPDEWWEKYLDDSHFRLDQELEAYQAQLDFIKIHNKQRDEHAKMKHRIAQLLSGPMYGNITSYQQVLTSLK